MKYILSTCLLLAMCCNLAQAQKDPKKDVAKEKATVGTVKVAKAQNVSIKWSAEDKEIGVLAYPVLYDKKSIYGFDGRFGNYYTNKTKFKFSRFSQDFKLEKTVDLSTKDPIHKKTCELEYIVSIKGQPYFFTSFRNYKKQKTIFFIKK
jgi:YHS domain-containing protein